MLDHRSITNPGVVDDDIDPFPNKADFIDQCRDLVGADDIQRVNSEAFIFLEILSQEMDGVGAGG